MKSQGPEVLQGNPFLVQEQVNSTSTTNWEIPKGMMKMAILQIKGELVFLLYQPHHRVDLTEYLTCKAQAKRKKKRKAGNARLGTH